MFNIYDIDIESPGKMIKIRIDSTKPGKINSTYTQVEMDILR